MPCAKAALRALSWSVPPCCRALRCLEAASGSEPLLRVQILGVDFTKSNEWTGKRSFGGRSLHDTSFSTNPYREAIKVIGKTLEVFDDDRLIPAYGFGTAETGADKLVSFNPEERPCHAFQEVEQRYLQLAQCLHFVSSGGQYHVLIIVADGQVTRPTSTPEGQLSSFEQDTVNAIWDNWQTVIMDASLAKRGGSLEYCPPAAEAQFALDALMEVPDQYQITQRLNILWKTRGINHSPEVLRQANSRAPTLVAQQQAPDPARIRLAHQLLARAAQGRRSPLAQAVQAGQRRLLAMAAREREAGSAAGDITQCIPSLILLHPREGLVKGAQVFVALHKLVDGVKVPHKGGRVAFLEKNLTCGGTAACRHRLREAKLAIHT
ncbi:RGLG2 [Symbiodinium sp. KB8]|nr:RGLG2 [Symbiodinium sp. KB8]